MNRTNALCLLAIIAGIIILLLSSYYPFNSEIALKRKNGVSLKLPVGLIVGGLLIFLGVTIPIAGKALPKKKALPSRQRAASKGIPSKRKKVPKK